MCSKIKNGVYGTWQFGICFKKDRIQWYIFDIRRSEFVIGETTSSAVRVLPFNTSQLKSISGVIKWLGIRGIDNSDIILAFLFEQRTSKYYLVTLRDDQDHITVIYEHFTYITRVVELTQSVMIKDEQDVLYAIIIWQTDGIKPKTFAHALRINVSVPSGMISTRIAVDENFEGKWYRPFIIENHLVLRVGIAYSLSFPLRKMSKLTDDEDLVNKSQISVPKIQCINKGGLKNDSANLFFGPVLYGDSALHYVHNTVNNDGQLWAYQWKLSLWKPVNVRLTRHAFNRFVTMHIVDNVLYMHGDCATKSCKTRAHIHYVDLANKL
uniref:DPPIV_N domain-containing protein n=1 Tax=Syphacia muris TaxID=451379 RepID=A0A0N5AT96_9BILA